MQVLPRLSDQMTGGDDKVVVELVLDAHCDLGESPIWDSQKEILYFVVRADINSALEGY